MTAIKSNRQFTAGPERLLPKRLNTFLVAGMASSYSVAGLADSYGPAF
jgi:hypothetical protein